MVLLSQIGALAGFTYTSWKIIGQWYRFRTKNEARQDDGYVFKALESAVAAAKADAKTGRSKLDYGAGAAASGHAHVYAEWAKLPMAAKVQLVEDLARLAEWSGQANKDVKKLRRRGGWKELSMRERGRLLGALDGLDFSFTEAIKQAGTDAASQAWLWQLTESLPMLAAEPEAMQVPVEALEQLQDKFKPLEEQVKAVLDARRAELLGECKEAVKPISVAAAVRNLQLLREVLVGDLSLDARRASQSNAVLTALLESPLAQLVPESASLRAETAAAEAALAQEGSAAAEAARTEALPGVEAAARGAYVKELVAAATNTSLWMPVPTSGAAAERPIAKANAAVRRVALTDAVLGELASAPEGEEGVEQLLEAARKLVPRLLPELDLVKPPSAAAPVEEAEKAAGESAEGEDAEEGDAAAAAGGEEAAPAQPRTPADDANDALVVLNGTATSSVAKEAARRLCRLLTEAAEKVLPRPSASQAALSDGEVVAKVAAAAVRNVLAAAGVQVDDAEVLEREGVKKEALAAADAKRAQVEQAQLAQVETAAAAARDKAIAQGLSDRLAALDSQSSAVRLVLASHKLRDAKTAKDPSNAVSLALSVLRDEELSALPALTASAARAARDLSERTQLSSELTSQLELGPGLTAFLEKLDAFLAKHLAAAEARDAAEADEAAEEQEQQEEEGAEEEGKKEDAGEAAVKAAKAAAVELDAPALRGARGLVSELLGEGLVLLELSGAATKKLRTLRETVEALQPNIEALSWSRAMTALKEMVSQLGPIGAAVDSRLKDIESEDRRLLLLTLRGAAVDLYRKLTDLLDHDGKEAPAINQALAAMKEAVYGMKIDRRVATLEALDTKLETLSAKRQELVGKAQTYASSGSGATEAAATALSGSLEAVGEAADELAEAAREYGQYAKLREHALGSVPPICPPDLEVPEFPDLAELQVDHAEDVVWLDMVTSEEEHQNEWCTAGFKLVARGQAAVLLMTDGIDEEKRAKITLDIGLPSTKSLLQLYAERLHRIQRLSAEALYGQGTAVLHPTPLYIMTTTAARQSIIDSLVANGYFGLSTSQVHVFAPDLSVPLLSEDGKVAMESPFRIARTQGSSGEVFRGLRESGMLGHMRRSGVRCLDVHAVEDNIMAKIADPIFLGYCHSIGLDCAAKVIDPDAVQMTTYGYAHAAGVLPGGAHMDEGPVAERLPHMLPAIGQFYFSMPWVVQVDSALGRSPLALYRLAPALVPAKGGAKAPGYRPERTICDFVLGLPNAIRGAADKGTEAHDHEGEEEEAEEEGAGSGAPLVPEQQSGLVVVESSEQFSAVWGRSPFFAPDTANAAIEDLLLLHTSWVEAAGGTLADEEEGVVEVAPLVSYSGEGLEEVAEGKEFAEAYDLDLQGFGAGAATSHAGGRQHSNVGPWLIPFLAVYAAAAAAKVASSLR